MITFKKTVIFLNQHIILTSNELDFNTYLISSSVSINSVSNCEQTFLSKTFFFTLFSACFIGKVSRFHKQFTHPHKLSS